VLVTGIAGPRGRQLARRLVAAGHAVTGVDLDPWHEAPPGVQALVLDHRKRGFEDLLRRERFDALLHLALHAGFRLPPPARHRLNLDGSRKVIQLAAAHRIPRLVVVSHAAVYGALPDNPCFMTEDAAPSVGRSFPEMQDVVAADLMAGAAMWQHPAIEIVVLRPVHAIGPTSRDVLAQLLRRRVVPTVFGFDPMVQVIHEEDLAGAFEAALQPGLRGVFNVVGAGEVPLSVLIEAAGARRLPLPDALAHLLLGRFLPDVAPGALEFLKHPCLLDGARFTAATGFHPARSLVDTVESF
jgi:UDP-glucose 4-epimerase